MVVLPIEKPMIFKIKYEYLTNQIKEMTGEQTALSDTLTNRDVMGFRMLLGRTALKKRFSDRPIYRVQFSQVSRPGFGASRSANFSLDKFKGTPYNHFIAKL